MKIQHRTPTVFSIYMVDVMCCALGCVILLWQVNRQNYETEQQESERQRIEAQNQTRKLLDANVTITSLDDVSKSLLGKLKLSEDGRVKVEIELSKKDAALGQLTVVSQKDRQELEALRKTHEDALAVLANLKVDVKRLSETQTKLEAEKSATELSLDAKIKAHNDLLKKIAATEGEVVILKKSVDDKRTELTDAEKVFRDKLTKKEQELIIAQLANKDLVDAIKKANLELQITETKLTDLELARKTISVLNVEKSLLLSRVQQAENRFAGVALTGKNVVFLIDLSGSMGMIYDGVFDPDKWPLVCDTVAHLMESIPLNNFQIILFNEKIAYPLARKGQFLKYEGKQQATEVAKILKSIRPADGTNMYDAFEEAFSFRDQNLDTIYVISDGLPNSSKNLPLSLTGQARTNFLTKEIRDRFKTTWNRPGLPKVRINTIGFFFESPELGAFLWALSRENDGGFVGMSKP